jgi:hypothetical protein
MRGLLTFIRSALKLLKAVKQGRRRELRPLETSTQIRHLRLAVCPLGPYLISGVHRPLGVLRKPRQRKQHYCFSDRGVAHRIRPRNNNKEVVLSSVAVFFLNLPEHTPRLPRPTLDRGNPQLLRAVKTDIRPLGVLQIPRPGVTILVHLDAVLGGSQRCGTQGEGRHTRSVEMDVTDSLTRS